MEKFFCPESMAVIGVSIRKLNLGRIILVNNAQIGFKGRLYGVGSEAGELEGVKVYSSVADLPEAPDVAIIITPAETVPGMLEDCGKKGIRRVVIESGGFSEFSMGRDTLEEKLLSIAARHDIRIIGPNCIGTINFETNLMMPFAFAREPLVAGNVAVISQSGGVGNTFLQCLPDNNIFLSKFVAVGNKLQLDEADFLDYLLHDDKTDVIVAYLEGFNRGRRFHDLCARTDKPVIVLKSNRSAASAKIAQSHTTALSSSDEVVDAAFRQAGVIRVEDEEELICATKIMQLPPMRGRRVAVLSRSGGHAVLTADACDRFGFEMVPFPRTFIDHVKTLYTTRVISHQNPLDLGEIFDYTLFPKILEAAIRLPEVDGVLFNHLYQAEYEGEMSRKFLDQVKIISERYGKPVSVAMISDADEIQSIKKTNPYPIFPTPLAAARALDISASHTERREALKKRGITRTVAIEPGAVKEIRNMCVREGRAPLTDEALRLCASAGLPVLNGTRIARMEDVENLTPVYPVAVKLLSRDASHKTDVGGVKLGIMNMAGIIDAISGIGRDLADAGRNIAIDGYFVQEMAPAGVEFFVGGRQDPVFGPVVIAGLGGIFVEVFRDSSIRLAPVSEPEAREMLAELISYPLLRGYRGHAPLDVHALAEVICRVSHLLDGFPEIAEIDCNPVIVYPEGKGISIVDSRIFFRDAPEKIGALAR